MKRTTLAGGLVLLLLTIMVAVSSCTVATDDADKKKNVALIVKMKHGDYWNTVKMAAEVAAKEFDVNLNFYAPDYEEDILGQVELIKQAIQDGTDAIVLAPSDPMALETAAQPRVGKSIPVIIIDSEMESAKAKSFIGTDQYDSGLKAGERLAQLVGESGKVAILSYVTKAGNAEHREKGLLEALRRHPGITIVAKEYTASDKQLASDLTSQLITEHPDLDGIAALNATLSLGAAEEIDRRGLAGSVRIVAIDSPSEVLSYIQEGVIQATITQQPFTMGYLGVKHAVDSLRGVQVPARVDTGTKVIDLENMFWSENQKLLFPFVK
ncbi:substrate-binding domain-containing protein [Brevibacillus migulae]|uniref:substrate-binding domain-containing protein n=1 Tax=Brevibacillus migulae TaxID=1644114 RepID=UPI001F374757|nr:substrate-binding domain-containing protein [Brevibacillus migulae]